MEQTILPNSWLHDARGVFLIGGRCNRCGKTYFPWRETCSACGENAVLEKTELSRTGRLYAFARVHQSKPNFPTPYVIGYVDLPEGVRVPARIQEDSGAALEAGCEVELTAGEIARSPSGDPILCYAFRTTLNREEESA